MVIPLFLKAFLSLIVVFAIMYFALKVIKKYTNIGINTHQNNSSLELKIANILYIDQNNKVITLSNNYGKNYVIAIGLSNSFLVDKYEISNDDQDKK